MRPKTNSEIAKALRVQSQYATDSETKWLMEEAALRIEAAEQSEPPPKEMEPTEPDQEPQEPAQPRAKTKKPAKS